MFNLDTSTDFGARVARRLAEERIIWLTTVREDGQPEPSQGNRIWGRGLGGGKGGRDTGGVDPP